MLLLSLNLEPCLQHKHHPNSTLGSSFHASIRQLEKSAATLKKAATMRLGLLCMCLLLLTMTSKSLHANTWFC
jgi:hypothetical protein